MSLRLVAVIAVFFSAAAFAQSPATQPATDPAAIAPTQPTSKPKVEGPTEPTWRGPAHDAQHKAYVEKAEKGGIDVYFLGDSLTLQWNDNAVWKKYYAPLKAASFGVGGDRTGHVLWRLQHGELPDACQPKLFVLLVGINNIKHHSAPQIAQGVTAIVTLLREKRPQAKILLLGVFPTGPRPNVLRDKVVDLNKIIAALDDGRNVRFLNFGDTFINADGSITQDIMIDGVHLTEKGYEIWARNMNPLLREMLGQPAAAQTQPTSKPRIEGPTEPTQAGYAWSSERHQALLKEAQRRDIDIYFLGDSITQRWADTAAWERNYAPLHAANFGVDADRTGNVLWRLRNGELPDTVQPRLFVLLIGTNNLSKAHTPRQVAEGITAIITLLREKRPQAKILLLGVFPRGRTPEDARIKALREKIVELNRIIATLDDGRNIRFLDLGDRFLNPDGTISRDVMKDYLHLTEKGYEIWAQGMNPLLRDMLGQPATAPVEPAGTK